MNYTETLNYLYNTLPMFSRMGSAAFKKDLTNIIILCERLGNPQAKLKTIHVGGTNGKGSVSHMLSAIFQSNGYKTGLYTSPHLYDFRERIRIDGVMISELFVVSFVEKIKPLINEVEPSFFEITVAMAFDYFVEEKIDIAIIEVGLGGRLDSTNIITPELSIITNIGWDHMNMLGNSLPEIAQEKAGIIKKDIPVVIGEKNELTNDIFIGAANRIHAPIYFAGDQFSVTGFQLGLHYINISVKAEADGLSGEYQLDLPGLYQKKNILTVLQAVSLLRKWDISKEAVITGLKEVKMLTGLWGRWDVIRENPLVVLDVAHNREGIEQLLLHLKMLQFRKMHMVIGTVKDKEVERVLELLPVEWIYYFTRAHIPRALPPIELQKKAFNYSLLGDAFDDVNDALSIALSNTRKEDIVVVCGSIFLVAEVNIKAFQVLVV